MGQKLCWTMSEAIIMLDALIAVQDEKLSRKEAIEKVSEQLRTCAINKGMEIDDRFRNTNGIALQMATMEYIFTDGKKGLKKNPMPQLFKDVVELYRSNSTEYEIALREAKQMLDTKSVQEQFFLWVENQVTIKQFIQLRNAYIEIEKYCRQHKLVSNQLTEVNQFDDVRRIANTIETSMFFRFKTKKKQENIKTIMRLYLQFVEIHALDFSSNMSKGESTTEQLVETDSNVSLDAAEEKKLKNDVLELSVHENVVEKADELQASILMQSDQLIFTDEKGLDFLEDSDSKEKIDESIELKEYVVDFVNEVSLKCTRPVHFSYFEEQQERVSSWAQLYVRVVSCLLEDYPSILHSCVNSNLSGKGRHDFTNLYGVEHMVAARKVEKNFFIETDLTANEVVKKIRKILDLCNVDYENLVIRYKKEDRKSITNKEAKDVQQTKLTKFDFSEEELIFMEWLRERNFTEEKAIDYIKVLSNSGKQAIQQNLSDDNLIKISDVKKLIEIRTALLSIEEFRETDMKAGNRFRAAITKLIEFRGITTSEPATVEQKLHTGTAGSFEKVEISDDLQEQRQVYYTEILSEYFGEDGYQPGRAIFRDRFRQYYAKKYDQELAESDENIDEILCKVGTQRDGRIFPKEDEKQSELLSTIIEDVLRTFKSGITAIYIEALFDKYKQPLSSELQIYNQDAMASLLLQKAEGRFQQEYSYFKNRRLVNVEKDLLRIMQEFHTPKNYKQIHEKAWFLPYSKLPTLLRNIDSVVNVGRETYFYAPNLPISTDELATISSAIYVELNNHSYISESRMMQLINEKCPAVILNTENYTIQCVRNSLGYLLQDEFAFKGRIISRKDEELRMEDVYAEFVRSHDVLQVKELSRFSEEINTGIYWNSVLQEMVRISDKELVRKDKITFDIELTDEILEEICPEEYIPIQEVNLFLHLPNVGYPWNEYLLESYLFGYSKKFKLIHLSFAKSGVYGAIVRVASNIQDYDALLIDVLSKSNALNSKESALQYIVDKGLQQRKRCEGIDNLMHKAKLTKEKTGNQ